jgi:hypothetical protein
MTTGPTARQEARGRRQEAKGPASSATSAAGAASPFARVLTAPAGTCRSCRNLRHAAVSPPPRAWWRPEEARCAYDVAFIDEDLDAVHHCVRFDRVAVWPQKQPAGDDAENAKAKR